MSAEVDFKALWIKEEAKDIPDTKDLLKKAHSLRRVARIRLITQSLILVVAVAGLLNRWFSIDNKQPTTIIGLVLMVLAIVSYLIAANQLLPMLLKSNIESSSQEYLKQLIRIKRKHEFLDTVMIHIYLGLMCVGLFLYMLQFAMTWSTARIVLIYGLTFAFMAFAWFFSIWWAIKNTLKPLNDMIKKLEAVSEQLKDVD